MKPSVKFEEGATHAWLCTPGTEPELFLKTPASSITKEYGDMAVKLCRDQIGEAYDTRPCDTAPSALFFIVESPGKTEVYESVGIPVIMEGGDAVVFIAPSAIFH